jgi:hypothetical protein
VFFSFVGILAPRPPIPARKYRQGLYLTHREKNDQEKGKTVAVIAVSARGKDDDGRENNGLLLLYLLYGYLKKISAPFSIYQQRCVSLRNFSKLEDNSKKQQVILFRLTETKKTKGTTVKG